MKKGKNNIYFKLAGISSIILAVIALIGWILFIIKNESWNNMILIISSLSWILIFFAFFTIYKKLKFIYSQNYFIVLIFFTVIELIVNLSGNTNNAIFISSLILTFIVGLMLLDKRLKKKFGNNIRIIAIFFISYPILLIILTLPLFVSELLIIQSTLILTILTVILYIYLTIFFLKDVKKLN